MKRRILFLVLLTVFTGWSENLFAQLTTHPRLWVTQADLPRLRSWASNANPMYVQGLHTMLTDPYIPGQYGGISTTYDAAFFPKALSAGLPLGNLDTNAVPNPNWLDNGTSGTEGYPIEVYAEVLAFGSLVEQDSLVRLKYARQSRNLLMHAMNEAAKGELANAPYRDHFFPTFNRANYYGEDWGLTVDWLQASNPPVLSSTDKATIRKVFLMWAGDCLNAYTAGDEHPHPVGVQNSTQLLSDTLQLRWAANNYFTGHMRNLTMMALSMDAQDDPSDQTTMYNGVAYPNLRSYIGNITGAWLYQQYAVYEDPATVAATFGVPQKGMGFAAGGLSVEGFMYGHALGYLFEALFALHTAGYHDVALSGPQIKLIDSPYWDNYLEGFLSSLAPSTNQIPGMIWEGNVYQYATYGDLLYYFISYWDYTDVWGVISSYDYLTGNTTRLAKDRWIITNTMQDGLSTLYQRGGANKLMGNSLGTTSILMFLAFDPAVNPALLPDPRPSMPTSFVSKPLTRILARTDWTDQARWFDYKCSGATINHQNGDANSFEFYRKGEWMTKLVSGYGLLTPDYLNTMGIQNTVSVASDSQPTNLAWFLQTVWQRGGQPNNGANAGDPKAMSSITDSYVYAQGDATNMYNYPDQWSPAENATDILHVSRSIVWLKPDHIVVYDRAKSKTANRFKRFHLVLTASPAINGNTATVTTPGNQKFYIQNLEPAGAVITSTPLDSPLPDGASKGLGEPANTRLTIEDPSKPTDVRFLNVLQGADAVDPMDVAQRIQNISGTPYDGVVVDSIATLFAVNLYTPFTGLTYTVPSTTTTHVVTGLQPNGMYAVNEQTVGDSLVVSITNGATLQADSAGVLYLTGTGSPGTPGAHQFFVHHSWNLLSLPVIPADFRSTSVFPSATSSIFAYEAGYQQVDSLSPGHGYWVEFSSDHFISLTGDSLVTDTVGVTARWNLIGALSAPIAVSSITSNPPGITTSPFFGYDQSGYVAADTLKPGQGYWVKVSSNGSLIMSASSSITARIHISNRGELPPPPPVGSSKGETGTPAQFALAQNSPNPFNPTTSIGFQIAERGFVNLKIYDVLGREVATLVNEVLEPGTYTRAWDAGGLASGMYLYVLRSGSNVSVKKMVVAK